MRIGFVARMERSAIRGRSINAALAPGFAPLHPGYGYVAAFIR